MSLGRLVVSPIKRGTGVGKELIQQLSSRGRNILEVSESSLFVLARNKPALSLYLSLGFKETVYPEELSDEVIYMVLSES